MTRLPVFKKFFPVFLFCYHLLFACVAWDYVLQYNGDALRYWFVGQDLSQIFWFDYLQPGTDMVKIFTFPLVQFFHFPFWTGFLLFSLLSYYGFYRLWCIIVSLTEKSRWAFFTGILLMLLPNLHLWTSFIGKESLLFVALVVLAEKLLKQQMKSKAFIGSFLLIALIRPHVAIIILISLFIAYFWKGGLNPKGKLYLSGISILCFAGLYVVLTKIAYIRNNDPWTRILYIYSYHIRGLKKTAAYVPLDKYSLSYKIFTFYFRPLPFERSGLLYQVWSFENLILLLVSTAVVFVVVKNFKAIQWGFFEIFAIFVVVLLAVMYVYAYANYGLIARTKIMTMPFLYLLMVKILAPQLPDHFKADR